MFLYQTGIQIYDQISTLRIWSKMKLHHSISLRFGLKEGENGFEKLETNATFYVLVSLSFPKVQNSSKSPESLYAWLSLKWVAWIMKKISCLRPLLDQPWITTKIALNIMKVSMHSHLPNAPINLRLNFNFEKLVKHETSLCSFVKVGLKVGENIL